MRRNCTWALALLLSTYCSQPTIEKVELSKARTGFRLTDGSAISTAEYTEYNPQLIQRPDGKLALIFASDRPCAGCSAGMHNLFIAVSVDEYLDDLQMPEFNTPVAIRPNGSTLLNSAQRIRFGAFAFSGNIAFAYQTGVGTYSFELSPATQLTGIGAGHGAIGNTTRTTDTFLGFGPEVPSMISRDGSMVVRYSKVSAAHNGRSPDNFLLTNAENISIIPSSVTGFNTSMLIADAGGVWFSTLQFPLAPAFGVNIALLEADLLLSNANVSATTAGFADFLLFSADDGVSDDLYVVTSHSVADLWLQDTFLFGDFSDSAALRNQWRTLSATLPAARGQMAGAVVGDKAYMIGGTPDAATITNTIYEFDFVSETFTNCGAGCGTWPTNIASANGFLLNNRVYVWGGITTSSLASVTNQIRYFDPVTKTVTADGTMPVYRADGSLAMVGSKMFLMGGARNTGVADATCSPDLACGSNNIFDTVSLNWTTGTAIPYNVGRQAIGVAGDRIFIFGGSNASDLQAVSEYDTTMDSWVNCGGSCPSLPAARVGQSAVSQNGSIFVMGGQESAGTTYYTNVLEFDSNTHTFTNCDGGCESMPMGHSYGLLLQWNSKLYYFGGRIGPGAFGSAIYEYTP